EDEVNSGVPLPQGEVDLLAGPEEGAGDLHLGESADCRRVDLGGFEPPTFTMPWCCATGLRYRPESRHVSSHPLRPRACGRTRVRPYRRGVTPSRPYNPAHGRGVRPAGDRGEVATPLARRGHLRGRRR